MLVVPVSRFSELDEILGRLTILTLRLQLSMALCHRPDPDPEVSVQLFLEQLSIHRQVIAELSAFLSSFD